jgi:hypothetical protein
MVRAEFQIPHVDHQLLEQIADQIDRIATLLDEGADVATYIDAFNLFTGHRFDAAWFAHYWEYRDLTEAALEAALPSPTSILGITREELVWLVDRIREGNEHSGHYLRILGQASLTRA